MEAKTAVMEVIEASAAQQTPCPRQGEIFFCDDDCDTSILFLHQQNLSGLTEVLLSALRLESEVQVLPLGCSGIAVEQQRKDIGGRAPAEASEAAGAMVSSASSVPRSRTSTWRGRMGLASSLSTMSWQ